MHDYKYMVHKMRVLGVIFIDEEAKDEWWQVCTWNTGKLLLTAFELAHYYFYRL